MIVTQACYDPLYTNSDKFITLVTGGRGSAKSFNVTTFIQRLTFESGHKILFSRYTLTSAEISIIPEFTEKIDLEGTSQFFKSTKKDIINVRTGSSILFRGIKTSSGNQTANLKSINGITTFVGDEMEEWRDEEAYNKLILSIRKKGIQNRVILILNPSDAEHFIYKKYLEETHKIVEIDGVDVQVSTHPNVMHLHTTYLDNIDNVSEEFLKEINEIREKSVKEATDDNGVFHKSLFQKTKYATIIIGRWTDIAEGVIFTNVTVGEFDESLPYCYGQDYGFSVDPDTLVRVAVDKKRKKIYVDEKYYATKKNGTEDLAKINKKHVEKPTDLIVGDSAELRLIADLKKLGVNIIPTEKKPGIVSASITSMLDYEIVVTEKSVNLRREFRNYSWNDKKAGLPIDNHNHAIDGLRYAFIKLTGFRMQNIKKLLNIL